MAAVAVSYTVGRWQLELVANNDSVTVFVVTPGSGTVLSRIGSQAELRCSVLPEYAIHWQIHLPGVQEPVKTSSTMKASFMDRNIAIQNVSEVESRLVIGGTLENNGTAAKCIAVNASDPTDVISMTEMVQVYFYGKM